MLRSALLMSLLCTLAASGCAADDAVSGDDTQTSMADGAGPTSDATETAESTDSASSDVVEPTDSGGGDAGVDPCAAMRAEWSALFDEARACTAAEECTKPYLGYQPCSCTVFVSGEADLNELFARDIQLKDACVADDVGCPAVECPQGVVSCDDGLCVTTFEE
jgi:hypothetical protein